MIEVWTVPYDLKINFTQLYYYIDYVVYFCIVLFHILCCIFPTRPMPPHITHPPPHLWVVPPNRYCFIFGTTPICVELYFEYYNVYI